MLLPNQAAEMLYVEHPSLYGLIKSSILFVIVPALIWLLPFLISKMFRSAISLKDYILNYGIAFIPVVAGAHLSKAVLKISSRIPYFQYPADDITGTSTAEKIVSGEITLFSLPVFIEIAVSILITGIMAVGIALSIKVIQMLNKKFNTIKSSFTLYGIPALYGAIFLFMILIWRWF